MNQKVCWKTLEKKHLNRKFETPTRKWLKLTEKRKTTTNINNIVKEWPTRMASYEHPNWCWNSKFSAWQRHAHATMFPLLNLLICPNSSLSCASLSNWIDFFGKFRRRKNTHTYRETAVNVVIQRVFILQTNNQNEYMLIVKSWTKRWVSMKGEAANTRLC